MEIGNSWDKEQWEAHYTEKSHFVQKNKKSKKTQKNTKVSLFPCNMEKNTENTEKSLLKSFHLTSKMVYMSNDNFSKVIFDQKSKMVFFSILHGNKLTFEVIFLRFFCFFVFLDKMTFFRAIRLWVFLQI